EFQRGKSAALVSSDHTRRGVALMLMATPHSMRKALALFRARPLGVGISTSFERQLVHQIADITVVADQPHAIALPLQRDDVGGPQAGGGTIDRQQLPRLGAPDGDPRIFLGV